MDANNLSVQKIISIIEDIKNKPVNQITATSDAPKGATFANSDNQLPYLHFIIRERDRLQSQDRLILADPCGIMLKQQIRYLLRILLTDHLVRILKIWRSPKRAVGITCHHGHKIVGKHLLRTS